MGGAAAVGWPFRSYRHFKTEDEGALHLALAITLKAFKAVLFALSEINHSLFQGHLLLAVQIPSMSPLPFCS